MKRLHQLNAPPIEGAPLSWYQTTATETVTINAYQQHWADQALYGNLQTARVEPIGRTRDQLYVQIAEIDRLREELRRYEEMIRRERMAQPYFYMVHPTALEEKKAENE